MREFERVRLAPNGKKVALSIATGPKLDLWILDAAMSTLAPLTTTGATRNPAWSPDGQRVLYTSTPGGRAELWWHAADGSGASAKAATPPHNQWNIDLSPDGRTVVYNSLYNGTFNLVSFALDSANAERELAASPAALESWGRFSPDGRQLAYISNESGRFEIYVRPFPENGARVQVSTAGGRNPVWAPDGKQLYYREGTRVMSAAVANDPAFRVVSREFLFDGAYLPDFDVSRDGSRFLMIASETAGPGVVVIPNWSTELRRLTAGRGSK
jgi:serine/threonine-protein kinase